MFWYFLVGCSSSLISVQSSANRKNIVALTVACISQFSFPVLSRHLCILCSRFLLFMQMLTCTLSCGNDERCLLPPVHHMWRFARDLCEGAYLKLFFIVKKWLKTNRKSKWKKNKTNCKTKRKTKTTLMHLISDAGWVTFCRASTNQVQGMTLARVSAESGNHQLVSDNNLAFYYILFAFWKSWNGYLLFVLQPFSQRLSQLISW